MLSWMGATIALLIVACSAVGSSPLEDRILDYLRNGYTRSDRSTDNMFLR